MSSTLQIRNLQAGYGSKTVLKGINLDIQPGQVTALIGPSGCGKTTLLRCLNRMNELTRGSFVKGQIHLDGEDIHKMDPMLLRRKVGMVFQKPNPFPMSIRENILYGVKAAGLAVDQKAVVQSSLTKAALWDEIKDRLGDNAFRLSLGQQQRVCIARSLAISPKILLMDEPAASLDPTSAAQVEASILALRGEYTIVIVTHNMQQARRVSDFTTFLFLGEIVEYGPTDQIFSDAHDPQTRRYVAGQFG